LLVVASSLLLGSGAEAITIVVTGAPGANGGTGVDGGPGDPAAAIAITVDPENGATATAGRGGNGGVGGSGGAGGDAEAVAETNAAGHAHALATATGGVGGLASDPSQLGGDGGSAEARAVASGAGGSGAVATATGGAGGTNSLGAGGSGGDATLVDAVSGSDSTALALEQRATGGGAVSRGGDATSTGDCENPGGGDLHVTLVAIGGSAFEAGGAHVGGSVTSTGAGDAMLEAIARTGTGVTGGALEIDPLLAHATGTGDATASLEAELLTGSKILSLTNQVDAIAGPDAAITLRQTVKAGQASESILDVSKSAAQLLLDARAVGGDASIVVRGSNDAGSLRMSGEAIGGTRSGIESFDAHATFDAQTSGDGHDIEIGYEGGRAQAIGGRGSRRVEGGTARVDARATALGDSAVRIDVGALGGRAVDFVGGDAFANAEGRGSGVQPVNVIATAIGDDGFYGNGGDARAEALAAGEGTVEARAIARGGTSWGRAGHFDGSAFARAEASGATGRAQALASSERLFDGEYSDDDQVGRIEVGIAATVVEHVAIAASTRFLDFGESAPGPDLDAFVRAAYAPSAAVLDEALSGNPNAYAAPVGQPRGLRALVEFRATALEGAAQSFSADIVLGAPYGGFRNFDPKPEAMLISFLDPELGAAAFGSLTLRSFDTRAPEDVFELSFSDPLDALAFLDDGRLVFGGLPRERHLEIVFETTGAEGEFFLDFIVAAVPEPSAATLVALALCAARSMKRAVASRPDVHAKNFGSGKGTDLFRHF